MRRVPTLPFGQAAIWAAVALAFADSSIVVLALPDLLRQLDTSISGVSLVITIYNAAVVVATPSSSGSCAARVRAPACTRVSSCSPRDRLAARCRVPSSCSSRFASCRRSAARSCSRAPCRPSASVAGAWPRPSARRSAPRSGACSPRRSTGARSSPSRLPSPSPRCWPAGAPPVARARSRCCAAEATCGRTPRWRCSRAPSWARSSWS